MIVLRFLFLGAALLLAACVGDEQAASSGDSSATESKNMLVVASNYPLYFLASQIAKGVDIAPDIVLPEFEGDPAEWVPTAEQIQVIQAADVVLLNGGGAEPWLHLLTVDQHRLIDTSTNITGELIALDGAALHQHGPDGEHSHQGTAFTTWLDPKLAIEQSKSVFDSLVRLAPSGEASFRDNLATLEQQLLLLDKELIDVFAKLEDQPVIFSHPVYQYLERRFDINGRSLHWEPDQELTTAAWIDLQQMLALHAATIMIWEDRPSSQTNQRLIDSGITSVAFHTIANKPEQGDFFSAMQQNIERLSAIL